MYLKTDVKYTLCAGFKRISQSKTFLSSFNFYGVLLLAKGKRKQCKIHIALGVHTSNVRLRVENFLTSGGWVQNSAALMITVSKKNIHCKF